MFVYIHLQITHNKVLVHFFSGDRFGSILEPKHVVRKTYTSTMLCEIGKCIKTHIFYFIYDMVLIYCNWVATPCQWSVDWYKIGNTQHKRRNNTQDNTKQ
jgi:hypothetical protein